MEKNKDFIKNVVDWKFYNFVLDYITLTNDNIKEDDAMTFSVSCSSYVFLSQNGFTFMRDESDYDKKYWNGLISIIREPKNKEDKMLKYTIRYSHDNRYGSEEKTLHFNNIINKARQLGYNTFLHSGFLIVEQPITLK